MKKLAFAAMLMGATGLLACGGDDDDGGTVVFPDAGGNTGATCNPISQQGCNANEKCTWIIVSESPFLGKTGCVEDGSVAIGGTCMRGEPGEATGYDDCAAGGLCINSLCREICSFNPQSCGDGFTCASYENTFSDDTNNNTGVCDPTCHPVNQDCDDGFGCYLQLSTGVGSCAGVPSAAAELKQNDACLSPNGGMSCYLNGCAEGYASTPAWLMGEMPHCTAYCTPVSTYLDDPDGDGDGPLVGTAVGEGTYTCGTGGRVGAITGQQCRFFQSIPFSSGYPSHINPDFGFCGSKASELWGDCEVYSEELIAKTIDNRPEGQTPQQAYAAFCGDDPARCGLACTDLETLDGIYETYCADPANSGGTSCSSAATRKAIWQGRLEYHRKKFEAAGEPFPFATID
jgi:hypothetical protein